MILKRGNSVVYTSTNLYYTFKWWFFALSKLDQPILVFNRRD